MNTEHATSDEVLEIIQLTINRSEGWMAYNNSLYFIDKSDVHFFKTRDEAGEFAGNNVSDRDHFNVIKVKSIADVFRQILYGEKLTEQLSNSKNLSIMNEKNFEYLKENLKYAGFGDKLNEMLATEINKQQPEFTLKLETEVNKQPVKAELYFKQSKETDMYFFNKYDMQLKTEKEGQDLSQTFYINKGHGITLKEAYNLLNGRAVHKDLENKEGEKYKAWVKLDFSEKDDKGNFKRQQFHENYGYNVAEALAKYPIKELLDEKMKEDLVKSMQKGNVQMVTFEKNGTSEKLYVEASPQFKSLNVYDVKMQRIEKQDLAEKYGQGMNGKEHQSASQSAKQTTKQDKSEDESGTGQPKQKAKRSKRQGIS